LFFTYCKRHLTVFTAPKQPKKSRIATNDDRQSSQNLHITYFLRLKSPASQINFAPYTIEVKRMHKLIRLNILAALALLAAGWLPAQSQKPEKKSGEEARIDSIVMAAELHEVVVTAKESQGAVTASRIDRSAMEFLQPTSLSDLMQLLPGGQQKDPDLSTANTIGLRETGTMDAQGNSSVNNNYAISSLGTLFVVDGNPLSTDANMQYTPLSSTQSSTTTSSTENNLNTTNRGIDMRSISTDDVESVEVVRGIPSVEYGNLTSGMVKINKIRRSTPFTARFKADGYSKLLSLGKGLKLSHTALLNIDAGMLDAKPDPTNNLQKYRRGNGSLRLTLNTDALRYSSAVDYTGSFDNSKSDPDINYGRIDEYKSTYNKIAITNNISWRPAAKGLFKSIDINTLITQQFDRLTQRRLVAPQRYGIVPTTSEEGVHDAALIFSEYEASFLSDGKPFTAYAKAKANFALTTGALTSNLLAGADCNYAKNFGRGQVYDLSRPLSVSGWGSRPRKFSDIPALSQVSAFIEYNGKAELASHRIELQAGLRTNSLTGLDSRYAMKGHIYLDPRANLKWSLPAWEWAGHRIALSFAGGVGKTSKMPTLNYLYPDKYYNDITELGYYDPNHPQDYSRFVVRSYIQDPTNYNIRPASNIKKELRMDFSFGDNTISVDYFRENMSSGFRYMAVYGVYDYNDYDETAIDSRSLTGKPSLEGLPYTPKRKLDGYTRADNGTRIDKEGIEFQFTSARIRPLRTRVNINGAWFKTRYSNSLPMFVSVADVVDGSAVSDRYVGLYDWNDGDWNETLSTNLMFDTQIPEWGLIFATSVQCSWFVKTQDMPKNGRPTAYLDAADGALHEYTDASAADPVLSRLIKTYNDDAFRQFTVPFAMSVNLKATKTIGKFLRLSMFANKIIDYTPDYYSNGYKIRRNVSPYFGVEANLTF